jgi:glycosyltransferase involved in cell wall biosynthesis
VNLLLAADDCSLGGHTCFMLELARGLSRRGHRVRSFFFQDAGFFSTYSRECAATLGDVADLRRLLAGGEWDVVHGDSCMLDLPAALRGLRVPTRLVVTRHAWNAPMGWHRANCDLYSTISESSAALCRPYTDHSVQVIPNGVDVNTLRPLDGPVPERPVIAWCGRSRDPVKNWPRFVSATWYLRDRFEFRAADATPPQDTERQAWEGAAHVTLRRRFAREELPAFFAEVGRSGGALLCTSRAEGMPLAVLEAMACGCPVIGPNVRGVRDVLEGPLRRWLYPAEASDVEVAAFVREAVAELQNPDVRRQFRAHVVEHYSLEHMVDRYEALYRLAARQTGASAPPPELAARLWEFAGQVAKDGRTRDAMFAARAAVRIAPRSLLRPERLLLAAACGSASRLRGARYFLQRAREKFGSQQYGEGIQHLAHACRLHPGALFSSDSPFRPRGRA